MEQECVSFAKINWFLHVGNRRGDGFHELETLFQTIDLADRLTFRVAERFELTCDDPDIPCDATNLVARAYELLKGEAPFPPLAIRIEKKIPAGGGLGGGSSNAAATLLAIVGMFALAVSKARLLALAAQLGSDVPFFILGGSAYATGRGEQLVEVDGFARAPLLLILPPERVATPDAYRRLAAMRSESSFPHGPVIGLERVREVVRDRAADLVGLFRNDLEDPVFAMHPPLASWKRELYDAGARFALMSGSGSTIFGVFEDSEKRDAALAALSARVPCIAATTVPVSPRRAD